MTYHTINGKENQKEQINVHRCDKVGECDVRQVLKHMQKNV